MSHLKQDKTTEAAAQKKSTLGQSMVIGSVVGAMEVLINHPLWTIKTRMQQTPPQPASHD